jgi:alpha-D-ribose 1-methylphosphonate 5-triphosphate synthase subunit PhnG
MNAANASTDDQTSPQRERQQWMAILAKAALKDFQACYQQLPPVPNYNFLRSPEIGLVMVRGRTGGTGNPFNLGEMTVTRCVIKMDSYNGFGYVAGRSHHHAELAAVCDALMQHPQWQSQVQAHIIDPLQAIAERQKQQTQRQCETTQVDFFTLVRGE